MRNGHSYEIVRTLDGSDTVRWIEGNATFHSKHGAIQESQHVFIANGLETIVRDRNKIAVFEMGFGSGLNALLTWKYAHTNNLIVEYHCVELYPLPADLLSQLNHGPMLQFDVAETDAIVKSPIDKKVEIDSIFRLYRNQNDISEFEHSTNYDIVYFDAFGPGTSPKLWEFDILKSLYDALKPNGILVTFCAQGLFRRTLLKIGFEVESLKGPPGKREMTRARKS